VDVFLLEAVCPKLRRRGRVKRSWAPAMRLAWLDREAGTLEGQSTEKVSGGGRGEAERASSDKFIPSLDHLNRSLWVCDDEDVVANEEDVRGRAVSTDVELLAKFACVRDKRNAEQDTGKRAALRDAEEHADARPRVVLVIAPKYDVVFPGVEIEHKRDELGRDVAMPAMTH